jgi:hypothetical protein
MRVRLVHESCCVAISTSVQRQRHGTLLEEGGEQKASTSHHTRLCGNDASPMSCCVFAIRAIGIYTSRAKGNLFTFVLPLNN